MKPHKHAELIKAWADGAEIEYCSTDFGTIWITTPNPAWSDDMQYRIKPQPKPDIIFSVPLYLHYGAPELMRDKLYNVKAVFDGETKRLKSVEML